MAEFSDEDFHAMNGEVKCSVCGEWVPDGEVIIATTCSGEAHVCDECLRESSEFTEFTVCGQTHHVDLMHDDQWCKKCFRDEQISVEERVS